MAEFLFAATGQAHFNEVEIKVIFEEFRRKVCDATDKSNCRLSPIIDSTNSAMKLCILDTIELVGSSRHDAAGVLSIAFHLCGQTLIAGVVDRVKVYSWELVI